MQEVGVEAVWVTGVLGAWEGGEGGIGQSIENADGVSQIRDEERVRTRQV